MIRKILFWIPRILIIFTMLFIMLFSFDSFEGDATFGMKILAFLIHNIPVFVLTMFLILAWKREILGGGLLIAAFIALGVMFKSFSGNMASFLIISPILISGIIFIFNGIQREKNQVK